MNRRDFLISTSGLLLAPAITQGQASSSAASSDIIFADFESGAYDGWTLTGNCWGESPASDKTLGNAIKGFQGKRFLCSFHPKLGGAAIGKAISKEFTIEKPFINFLIGGGNLPGEACINLVVDGKVVRTETGNDRRTLELASWQVRPLVGKRAHLEVLDTSTVADLGNIMIDDIRFAVGGKYASYDQVDFNKQYEQNAMDAKFQQAVQQTVQRIVDQNHVVGVTVACVIDGKLVAAIAVGERKFGSGVPIKVTDPMHIGSNTKGMTALLFARLVEAGKLNWNQSLKQTFGAAVSDDFKNVPVIELLRQRSGITDATSPEIFAAKYLSSSNNDYSKPMPSLQVRRQARHLFAVDAISKPAGYVPLSKHQYCNANFIVAGAVEEIVTGKPWEELMKSEVFELLHMKTAGFGPMGTGRQDDISVPWQHLAQQDGSYTPIYHDNPTYIGPAGTVHCCALDLANYAYAHATGSFGLGSYLTPKSWNIIRTPPPGGGYGCGVTVSGPDANGLRDMGHRGSNTLSCSNWSVNNHGRVICIVMFNSPSPGLDELIKEITLVAESKL